MIVPIIEKATAVKAKVEKLTGVKGMNDVLPPDTGTVEWFESRVRFLMARYAYRNIRTPIVERTPVFVRGLGEVTDIVEKEMYSFEDRLNGDSLTLRPEATAGVVRAVVESGWNLNELRAVALSLEDVFLELTGAAQAVEGETL